MLLGMEEMGRERWAREGPKGRTELTISIKTTLKLRLTGYSVLKPTGNLQLYGSLWSLQLYMVGFIIFIL